MCGPQLVPRLSRVDSNTSVVDSLGDGIAVLTIGLFGAAGLGAEVADTLFPPRQTDGEACHPLWGLAGPLRAAGRGPCGVMRAPYGQAWRSCGTGVGAVANPGHSSPAPRGGGTRNPPAAPHSARTRAGPRQGRAGEWNVFYHFRHRNENRAGKACLAPTIPSSVAAAEACHYRWMSF
jgi:hypothetical protein